jgi:hypothetical protein
MTHSSQVDVDTEVREASIGQFEERPVAACIVISTTDLRALGIDPVTATSILYWVDSDSRIQIVNPDARN